MKTQGEMESGSNVASLKHQVQKATLEIMKGISYATFGELVRTLYVLGPSEFAECSAVIKQVIDGVKNIKGDARKVLYVMAFSDYWISSKAVLVFLDKALQSAALYDDFFALLRHVLELTVKNNENDQLNGDILKVITQMTFYDRYWDTAEIWYGVGFRMVGLMLHKWPNLGSSDELANFRQNGSRVLKDTGDPGLKVIMWEVVGYGSSVYDQLQYYGELLFHLKPNEFARYELVWTLLRKINCLLWRYREEEPDKDLLTLLLNGHLVEPFEGRGFSFQVANIVALVNRMRTKQWFCHENRLLMFTLNSFFVESSDFAAINALIKLNYLDEGRRNEYLARFFYTFNSKLSEEVKRYAGRDNERVFLHGIRLLKHLECVFGEMHLEQWASRDHRLYSMNFSLDRKASIHLTDFLSSCLEFLCNYIANNCQRPEVPIVDATGTGVEVLAKISDSVAPLLETRKLFQYASFFAELLRKAIGRMTPLMIETVYLGVCRILLRLDSDVFVRTYLGDITDSANHIAFVQALCNGFVEMAACEFVGTRAIKQFVRVMQYLIDNTAASRHNSTHAPKVSRLVRVFMMKVERKIYSNVFYSKLFRVLSVIHSWLDVMCFNLNSSNQLVTPAHVFEMMQKLPPFVLRCKDCCLFFLDRMANDLSLLNVVSLLNVLVYALDWYPERALPFLIIAKAEDVVACACFDLLCQKLQSMFETSADVAIREQIMDFMSGLPGKIRVLDHVVDVTNKYFYCKTFSANDFRACDLESMYLCVRSLAKGKSTGTLFGRNDALLAPLKKDIVEALISLYGVVRESPRCAFRSYLLMNLYALRVEYLPDSAKEISIPEALLFHVIHKQKGGFQYQFDMKDVDISEVAEMMDHMMRYTVDVAVDILLACNDLERLDEHVLMDVVWFFEKYALGQVSISPVPVRVYSQNTLEKECGGLLECTFLLPELYLLPAGVQRVLHRLKNVSYLPGSELYRYLKVVRHSYISVLALCEILAASGRTEEIVALVADTEFEKEDVFILSVLKRIVPSALASLPLDIAWESLSIQEQVALSMFWEQSTKNISRLVKHWFELNDILRVTASLCLKSVLNSSSESGKSIVRNHLNSLSSSVSLDVSSSFHKADLPDVILFHIFLIDAEFAIQLLTSQIDMDVGGLEVPGDVIVDTCIRCLDLVTTNFMVYMITEQCCFEHVLSAVLRAANRFAFVYSYPFQVLLEYCPQRTASFLSQYKRGNRMILWDVICSLMRDRRCPGLSAVLHNVKLTEKLFGSGLQEDLPVLLKKELSVRGIDELWADIDQMDLVSVDEVLDLVDVTLDDKCFLNNVVLPRRPMLRFMLGDMAARLATSLDAQKCDPTKGATTANPSECFMSFMSFTALYELVTGSKWSKLEALEGSGKKLYTFFQEAHKSNSMIYEKTAKKMFCRTFPYFQSYEPPLAMFGVRVKSKKVFCGDDLTALYDVLSLTSVEAQNVKHLFELIAHNMGLFPDFLSLFVDHLMITMWSLRKNIEAIPDADMVQLLEPMTKVVCSLKGNQKTEVFLAPMITKLASMATAILERVARKGYSLTQNVPLLLECLATDYGCVPVDNQFIDVCRQCLAVDDVQLACLLLRGLPGIVRVAKNPQVFKSLLNILGPLTDNEYLFIDAVRTIFDITQRVVDAEPGPVSPAAHVLMNCLKNSYDIGELCRVLPEIVNSGVLYRDALINLITQLLMAERPELIVWYDKMKSASEYVGAWLTRAAVLKQSAIIKADDYFLKNMDSKLLQLYQPKLDDWTKVPLEASLCYFAQYQKIPAGLLTPTDEVRCDLFTAPKSLFMGLRSAEILTLSGACFDGSVQNKLLAAGEIQFDNQCPTKDPDSASLALSSMRWLSQAKAMLTTDDRTPLLSELLNLAMNDGMFSEIPQLVVLRDLVKTGELVHKPSSYEPSIFVREINEMKKLEGMEPVDTVNLKYKELAKLPKLRNPENVDTENVNAYFRYCLMHNHDFDESLTKMILGYVRKDLLLLAAKLHKLPPSIIDGLRSSISYLPLHWCHLQPDLLGWDLIHPGIQGARDFSSACGFVIDSCKQISDMAEMIIELDNNGFEKTPTMEWKALYRTIPCSGFVPPLLERFHESVMSATFNLKADETAVRITCLTDFGSQIDYILSATAPSSPSFTLLLRLLSKLIFHSPDHRSMGLSLPSLLSYPIDDVFWLAQTSAMPLLRTTDSIRDAVTRMHLKQQAPPVPVLNLANFEETFKWGEAFVRSFACLSCVKFILERETSPPLDIFVDERNAAMCITRFVGHSNEESLRFRNRGALQRFLFPPIVSKLLPQACAATAQCFLNNNIDVSLYVTTLSEPVPRSSKLIGHISNLAKVEEIQRIIDATAKQDTDTPFSWA